MVQALFRESPCPQSELHKEIKIFPSLVRKTGLNLIQHLVDELECRLQARPNISCDLTSGMFLWLKESETLIQCSKVWCKVFSEGLGEVIVNAEGLEIFNEMFKK